jgi:hypothetical protein
MNYTEKEAVNAHFWAYKRLLRKTKFWKILPLKYCNL